MNQYLKDQILPLLGLLLLLTLSFKIVWRWRVLHGSKAQATVHYMLGKQGSGSSGIYEFQVRYDHPQRGPTTALVQTSKSQHDAVSMGTPIEVAYLPDAPLEVLPAQEYSITWKYAVGLMVGLLLAAPLLNSQKRD